MSPLVWLAVPVVALVLATLWVGWTSRPRPRADTHETVQAHQRFVAAFEGRRTSGAPSPQPPAAPTQPTADDRHRQSA